MSIENDYQRFYRWIEKQGGQKYPPIEIDVKNDQRGLFTRETIPSHTALIVIPLSLIVNRHLSTIGNDRTEPSNLIVFLVNEFGKRENSSWFSWIHLLNIDEQSKDFLSHQMHLYDCVEHSTLGQALTARYQQLQEEYAELSQSGLIDVSFDIFAIIDHLVWSRVLDLPDEQSISLVPFVDFANHSLHPNARWFLDDEKKNFILRSERQLDPGEEITISYGEKSNEELLYLYGFTLPNNPHDRVTLPVSLSEDDEFLEEKFQLIQENRLPPRLTLDTNGQLTDASKQLAIILSSQSLENPQLSLPYFGDLFNEYRTQLNQCSTDSIFVENYLHSQKSIMEKAIEQMKK